MALRCDDITPCPVSTKKGALGGYFDFLQAPFSAAAAKVHHVRKPFTSGVAAGAAQVPYWSLPLRHQGRCQCNASMPYHSLNSLEGTINDEIF
jgi:hypothetical protein